MMECVLYSVVSLSASVPLSEMLASLVAEIDSERIRYRESFVTMGGNCSLTVFVSVISRGSVIYSL